MKKIILVTLSVLCGSLVFAKEKNYPLTTSSVVVLNSNGSKVVKVFYHAAGLGKVRIAILNEKNDIIFSETFKKIGGFMRPYNFEGLADGAYTISIEDEFGKKLEKLNYSSTTFHNVIHLARLSGEEDKYVLTGRSLNKDKIQVSIYDAAHQLVYEEDRKVMGEFGEVFNLKNIPGSFTIEVTDSHGMLKTLHY